MAYQLVYTSAARLLDAGRSGFGTVARSKAISPLLVSAIERVSQFSNIRGTERSRVIFVHRRMVAGSNRFHIISRIADAGADYTGRTNHIAHHLIVSQEEMTRAAAAGITPADVIAQFPWLSRWEGTARFLTPEEDVNLAAFQPLGRQSARRGWASITGNPSHARLLSWEGAPRNGVLLIPDGTDPVALLSEGLAEFGTQSWSKTFTTSLETTDELSELDWIIAIPTTFPEIQRRCGGRTILDLTVPHSLPVPPEPVPEPKKTAPPSHAIKASEGVPQPDIRPNKSQPGQVRARTVTSPQERKVAAQPVQVRGKRGLQIILGAAAVLTASAILGFVIFSNKDSAKPESDLEPTGSAQPSQQQQRAISDLKQAGIPDKEAESLATAAGEDAQRWATFVIGIIAVAKDGDPNKISVDLPNPPEDNIPAGAPDWVNSLVDAQGILATKAQEEEFDVRLKAIPRILELLESAADSLKNSALSKEECKSFENTLTRREIKGLLGAGESPPSADSRKEFFLAIYNGCFNPKEHEGRYRILSDVIREKFTDLISAELIKSLEEPRANLEAKDIEGLKQAWKLWQDREPSHNLADEFVKTGFIPPEFNQLRQDHLNPSGESLAGNKGTEAGKGEGQNKKESGPDLTGVEQKQVILVTPEQLKDGVKVPLLEKLLVHIPATELLNKGLTIFIGKEKFEKELNPVTGKEYFAEKFNAKPSDGVLIIYRNGGISLGIEQGASVRLSFKSGDRDFVSYVLVDRKESDPIISDLKFGLIEVSEDSVKIDGELKDWLLAIGEKNRKNIIYTVNPKKVVLFNKEKFLLYRHPLKAKGIIFSDSARKEIEGLLDVWIEIEGRRTSLQSEKAEKTTNLKAARENLKLSIQKAIGEALIASDLKKPDVGKITTADDAELVLIYKKKYGETLSFDKGRYLTGKEKDTKEKNKNFRKDLKDVVETIGRRKFDEVLKSLVGEDWNSAVTERTAREKIIIYINSIISNSKKPEPRPSLLEDLKAVSEITVKTSEGRELFKASRKQ